MTRLQLYVVRAFDLRAGEDAAFEGEKNDAEITREQGR